MPSSIQTSQVPSYYSLASRSIASNASDGIRLTKARDNFANTATSSRGKKRTSGLVFENNHKNPNGQYIRYTRSGHYSLPSQNQANVTIHMNPFTRSLKRVKVARISDKRKALFVHALSSAVPQSRTVAEILRIVDGGYKPPGDLVTQAIQTIASRPGGLKAIEHIFKTGARPTAHDDAYEVVLKCDPTRGESLMRLLVRFVIKASYSMLIPVINHGLDHGFKISSLLGTCIISPVQEDDDIIRDFFVRLLMLQEKSHPTVEIPIALRAFLERLRHEPDFEFDPKNVLQSLWTAIKRAGRITRWIVENIYVSIQPYEVRNALYLSGSVPLAVYLLSKRDTDWDTEDKELMLQYIKALPGRILSTPRKVSLLRTMRAMLSMPVPNATRPTPGGPIVNFNKLETNSTLHMGRLNTWPRRELTVHVPSSSILGYSDIQRIKLISNRRTPHHPPERLSSQENLNRYLRNKGLFRGITYGSDTNYKFKNPTVPPSSTTNSRNVMFDRANAAARKIQNTWRRRRG